MGDLLSDSLIQNNACPKCGSKNSKIQKKREDIIFNEKVILVIRICSECNHIWEECE